MRHVFALSIVILLFPSLLLAQNTNINGNTNISVDAGNVSFSQVTNLAASVGISPESKWYFLEKWKEGIELFLTFNKEKKIEKRLQFAERRLAEYGQLLDKGNNEKAAQILDDYQKQSEKLQSDLEKLKSAKKDISGLSAKVSERIVKHQEVLSRVYQKAPAPAKKALEKVLQKAEDKLPGILERLTNPDVYSGAINKARTIKNKIQNSITNEDLQ